VKQLIPLFCLFICSDPFFVQAAIGGLMTTSGDVSREQAEARVIDRRKRLEDERKMRIFNAKQRTIGLDVQVKVTRNEFSLEFSSQISLL
jgi:hypothetical protein